jgi:hypothetical protein
VYVVVPLSPEWRYGLLGDSMPWYPSVKLFRQREVGEWDGPVAAIRAALQGLVPAGS